MNHREYVGGMWDKIGLWQFDFMRSIGLSREDILLDIGCGSFRAGVHFMKYLKKGNYICIDHNEELVSYGIKNEAPYIPEVVITNDFEFDKLSRVPDKSIAHSLFTHLPIERIKQCLDNLREFVCDGHELYATYLEGDPNNNPVAEHDQHAFKYRFDEIKEISDRWDCSVCDAGKHPRNHKMIRFIAI